MNKSELEFHPVRLAYERGYRVLDNGSVFYPKTGKILKLRLNTGGYLCFNIKKPKTRKSYRVNIHKLRAYQKFGEKALEPGTHTRHLNGDKLDNSEENIDIGTPLDNVMARCPIESSNHALKATSFVRKFSDELIIEIRSFHSETKSYKKTIEKFGLTGKSTLHYILNNQYTERYSKQ